MIYLDLAKFCEKYIYCRWFGKTSRFFYHISLYFRTSCVVLFRIAFSRFWRKIVKWRQKSLKTTKKLKKLSFRLFCAVSHKYAAFAPLRSASAHICAHSTKKTKSTLFQLFCRFQAFWRHLTILSSKNERNRSWTIHQAFLLIFVVLHHF